MESKFAIKYGHKRSYLGVDHLTFDGGGRVGDFEKKFLQGNSE